MNLRPFILSGIFFVFGLTIALMSGLIDVNSESSVASSSQTLPGTQFTLQSNTSQVGQNAALVKFGTFAPPESTVFFVHRPRQTVTSNLAKAAFQSSAELPWFPPNPEKIDSITVAASDDSLQELMLYPSQQAFENIADQLQFDGEQSTKKAAPPRPTTINFFNSEFSALIQFSRSADWQYFKTWFESEEAFQGKFRETKWNGLPMLECDQENTCVVLKLNDRNFVIGNKSRFDQIPNTSASGCPFVSRNISHAIKSGFEGELYFAMDLTKYVDRGNEYLPKQGIFSLANQIKEARFEVSLQGRALFAGRFGFTGPEVAQQFKSELEKAIGEYTRIYDRAPGNAPPADSQDGFGLKENEFFVWQAKQGSALAKTLIFEHRNSEVMVTLPRPAGFESLADQYAKQFDKELARQKEMFKKPPAVIMGRIAVARRRIEKGQLITADDIKFEQWPEELIPENSFDDDRGIVDRNAKEMIYRGKPITNQDITSTE